jgi:hypothetical protein
MRMNKLLMCLIVISSLYHTQVFSATSPYPPSSVITDIVWDFGSNRREAPGSDLWPTTWADDNHLYATFGDGGGFGGSNDDGRVLFGVSRIEGSAEAYVGFNVFGGKNPEVPADFVGKANTLVSIDGSLFMFLTEQDQWMRAKIGRSDDHGRTWTFNGGHFSESGWDFEESGGAFAGPAIIQFGRDYAGARDDYVYVYSEKERTQSNKDLLLARVHKTQIQNRSAYEFYSGIDGSGNPTWSSNLSNAISVFHDENGVNWGYQVAYNPGIKRYLLTVRRVDSAGGEEGAWGIFDAPEPWGPWTTVAYYDDWDSETPIDGFGSQILFNFPTKWMSADGRTLWTVVSMRDSFITLKATLSLNSDSDATAPTRPTNLVATASSDSSIELGWSQASDPDSGIVGYNIYRDGISIGSTFGLELAFTDSNIDEATAYTYEVSAVNGAGLEGSRSAPAVATTFGDTTEPTLVAAEPTGGPTRVTVTFSEPVEKTSAELAANYNIEPDILVLNATLGADKSQVRLGVTELSEDVNYTLSANNILDQASSPNMIPANSQISFQYSAKLIIANTSPSNYEWGILELGAKVYVDRNFTYQAVPAAYSGFKYLQTANDDKAVSNDAFLSFDVSQPSTVYVGYDELIGSLPTWLQGWTDTGVQFVNNDTSLHVYSRSFDAGTVTLGGNEENAGSMYVVAIGDSNGAIDDSNGSDSNTPITGVDNYSISDAGGGGAMSLFLLILAIFRICSLAPRQSKGNLNS